MLLDTVQLPALNVLHESTLYKPPEFASAHRRNFIPFAQYLSVLSGTPYSSAASEMGSNLLL